MDGCVVGPCAGRDLVIHDLDRVVERCRALTQTLLTGGRAAR